MNPRWRLVVLILFSVAPARAGAAQVQPPAQEMLIVSLLSLCVLQAGLIAMLLAQRRQRSQAGNELAARPADCRGLANRLIRAQEGERTRVARELHDDVTQRLAALGLEAEQAGMAGTDSAATRALRNFGRQASALSADAARLSHQLHRRSSSMSAWRRPWPRSAAHPAHPPSRQSSRPMAAPRNSPQSRRSCFTASSRKACATPCGTAVRARPR